MCLVTEFSGLIGDPRQPHQVVSMATGQPAGTHLFVGAGYIYRAPSAAGIPKAWGPAELRGQSICLSEVRGQRAQASHWHQLLFPETEATATLRTF